MGYNRAIPTTNNPGLRASIRDGMWYSVMAGAGETYLLPFALFLQATRFQVGVLAALPPLLGALAQAAGVWLMDRVASRRRLIVAGASLQTFAWLPIACLPFVMEPGRASVTMLIALVAYYYMAGNVVGPAWNSLIGDLVPASVRGTFFGQRNKLCGLSTFTAMACAGGLLHVCTQARVEAIGFLVLFMAALSARAFSVHWLRRYDDPPRLTSGDERFSFWQFLRRTPHSNFAKFVIFVATMNLSASFSGPYFAVYMLQALRLSYFQYTFISCALTLTQFLTMHYWGRFSDRFGNKRILSLCGWGVSFIPLLWLVSASPLYLVALQTYTGFVWAGFNLASASFMFDAVTPPKRGRCAAYQAIVTAAFVFVGSLAGGAVAERLPAVFDFGIWVWHPASNLLAIFVISSALRLIAVLCFLDWFREVREVEAITNRDLLFRVARLQPASGATFGLHEPPLDHEKT